MNDLLMPVAIAMHLVIAYLFSMEISMTPPPLIIVQYSFELKFHDRISTYLDLKRLVFCRKKDYKFKENFILIAQEYIEYDTIVRNIFNISKTHRIY